MIKLFNLSKKEESKSSHFSELGTELLEKNKTLEDINKSSELVERLYK